MINITQNGWNWPELESQGTCQAPNVWFNPAQRVSQILGPDGEPLMVPYPRVKLGFDLSPRKLKE